MKGCFNFIKFIISTIFTGIIALIILFPCGGLNYIKNFIDSQMNQPVKEVQAKAQKFGDFSRISKDYELVRTVNMFGASAIIARHKKTGQKMFIINPGWVLNLSKNDINSNSIESTLKNLSSKLGSQSIKLNSFEIGKKGVFKAFNQNIPYINIKANFTSNVNKSLEGIIGVIDDIDNKSKIIVSTNEMGRYRQEIAEKYFKNIKLAKADVVRK